MVAQRGPSGTVPVMETICCARIRCVDAAGEPLEFATVVSAVYAGDASADAYVVTLERLEEPSADER